MRTGSCDDESRCRRSRATKRGGSHLRGQEGGHDGHRDEEDEQDEGQPGIAVREQHRHRHDGPELADRPDRQHGRPERRAAARRRRAGSAAASPAPSS